MLESWVAGRGFTVTYRHTNAKTLRLVREYQKRMRDECPEWLTRLDFDSHDGDLLLHVFPKSDLPFSVFWRPNHYSSRNW